SPPIQQSLMYCSRSSTGSGFLNDSSYGNQLNRPITVGVTCEQGSHTCTDEFVRQHACRTREQERASDAQNSYGSKRSIHRVLFRMHGYMEKTRMTAVRRDVPAPMSSREHEAR